MANVTVSQETFDRLKDLAEPLVDTAETVIQRLLDAYEASERGHSGGLPSDGRTREQRTVRRDRKRARKGERTHTREFMDPLRQVLQESGGELPANLAIDRVGELLGDRLNEVDRGRLRSGEVRWRNSVRWARQKLEQAGEIDANAPYGVWRLANDRERD